MVPTEILAEQHARTLAGWLEGTGIEVALVAAAARGKGQREARARVADGTARIAVGTHALLEQEVGVRAARPRGRGRAAPLRRAAAREAHLEGPPPRRARHDRDAHPAHARARVLRRSRPVEDRRAAPGRTPVATKIYGDSQRRAAYDVARRELEAGRQVYVVYPLVAESEKTDLADATSGAEELRRVFAGHEVGLLHGQLKAEEKQAVMDRFRAGALRVLVATTVIEVGVDVPNASVMIVEHAERFGLSQLHQLRGRVGRGAARSHCLLLAHFKRVGDEARERLHAMEETQDGFEIARVDLRIRGPGELLGTRQSGQKLFEIADLYRDEAILEEAREDAFALVDADPRARPARAPGGRRGARGALGRAALAGPGRVSGPRRPPRPARGYDSREQ